MKMKQMTGWLLACCAGGMATGARAIEPPVPVEPPKVEVQAEGQPGEAPAAQAEVQGEAMPQVGMQAYLGVGGTEVSEVLAEHLGLAGGGVVVESLDPEGPAAKAGLARNDVITKVAGKPVASQDALREAVTFHEPGEEVVIDYIHRGKAESRKVALGERPAALGNIGGEDLDDMLDGLPEAQAKRVREAIEQNLKALGAGPQVAPGDAGEIPPDGAPEALKELQQRIGKVFQGMGGILPGGQPGAQMQFNMQSSSSIRLMDNEGSVEMEMKDGGKQVRVRDKAGKVQWEGPFDTAQDKAAAPDDVRARIDKLNFDVIEGGGAGMRLRIGPGGVIQPPDPPVAPQPAPKPEAKPAE